MERTVETERYREAYARGMEALVRARYEAEAKRRETDVTPDAMAADPEGYRTRYRAMLGWPLTGETPDAPPPMVRERVDEVDGMARWRVRVEVLPNLWMHGLLFAPTDEACRMPLVIAQHGGGGTPELCSDLWGPNNYNHMVRRVLARCAAVFAPQLLLWNCAQDLPTSPACGTKYDRGLVDARLRMAGGTVTAVEVYGLGRCLDALCGLPFVDGTRIGMLGLSYRQRRRADGAP